jgi:hypothetical protein
VVISKVGKGIGSKKEKREQGSRKASGTLAARKIFLSVYVGRKG